MTLEIIIIISLVAILAILARKIPNVISFKKIEYKPAEYKPNKNIKGFAEKEDDSSLTARADFLFDHGSFKEAEELYIKIISHDPKNPKLYNRLGVLYLELKNYPDAKAAFTESIKYDSSKASRFYNYALACVELKEFNNAIEALEKAIKLDSKNKKYSQTLKDIKKKLS
jgi:tetratricopeptide (TPR) repeat protein